MTKEEKIAAIVEANLKSMDLKALERYYIDTQVFEHETYASEAEISRIHDITFKDPNIHSLYYVRSQNKAMKHKVDKSVCEVCSG